jgi:Kef-type K+ transport system membrane component KefB
MTNWDRIWRASGVGAVVFLVVAGVIYGSSPKVGASAEKLVSFYDGDRTRILIATVIFCIGFLNMLWFAAALSTDLRDAGKGGWARAGITSKAAFAAGVAAVVLVLLGGTTWARDGFWAPDGGYAIVSGIILYVWVAGVSGFLAWSPSAVQAPDRAAVPTA